MNFLLKINKSLIYLCHNFPCLHFLSLTHSLWLSLLPRIFDCREFWRLTPMKMVTMTMKTLKWTYQKGNTGEKAEWVTAFWFIHKVKRLHTVIHCTPLLIYRSVMIISLVTSVEIRARTCTMLQPSFMFWFFLRKFPFSFGVAHLQSHPE